MRKRTELVVPFRPRDVIVRAAGALPRRPPTVPEPGPPEVWKCAGRGCGAEGPKHLDAHGDPVCRHCGADTFPRDDGGWPTRCAECRTEHTEADGCPRPGRRWQDDLGY